MQPKFLHQNHFNIEFCEWEHSRSGLCWVWASHDSRQSNPFGEWRAPTEDEWIDRPDWSDLVNHCHAEDFNGGICDIAHAQEHGMCFCREETDANCKSVDCDIMFVKPQSKREHF